jgi:ATP-binding cassette subfamily F protein uup
MDEPTNDLDAETLDLLEDLLMEYPGTLLLVSHDREFLNNVVSSTLVLSGDGSVQEFVGGYDDWLSQAAIETAAAVAVVQKSAPEKSKLPKEKARKLSFNDQRELEALPEKIAAIEKEQEELHARLADPEFYKSAGGGVVAVNDRLAALEQDLEAAFLRWDELESLKSHMP